MYRYYPIPDTNIVLHIDREMEYARVQKFSPLLLRHYKHCRKGYFDHSRYKALSPYDRCFDSAVKTAKEYGLKYWEGLLIISDRPVTFPLGSGFQAMPLGHGWCTDQAGNIVDPTCAKLQHLPHIGYFGFPIRLDYVAKWHSTVGYYGCLDGDVLGTPIGIHPDPVQAWLDA